MNAAENQNGMQRSQDSAKQDDASGLQQFHPNHSPNIELHNDYTLLLPKESFEGFIYLYSKKPLAVGELFLLETEKISPMIGLTNLEPHVSNQFEHDQDVFGVGFFSQNELRTNERPTRNILGDGAYLRTSRGLIPKTMLLPTEQLGNSVDLTRMGIIYVPTENDPTKGDVHFIFNGVELTSDIPVGNVPLDVGPLHVVMAIFTEMKPIRIVQTQGVSTLQNACRNVIRETFSINAISKMELPKNIKLFVLERDY